MVRLIYALVCAGNLFVVTYYCYMIQGTALTSTCSRGFLVLCIWGYGKGAVVTLKVITSMLDGHEKY